ncbi:MAG: helix-turn-helix domain-containing protein [Clostridia bacterium]|nr:helix-turn-helix domain-containing protein [Clostridia bacterium]
MKINEQIAALRKEKEITQGELAQALGVTNQAVSKWESGQCCPDIQLLPEIAKYFGISIGELMGEEAAEKRNEEGNTVEAAQKHNDPLLCRAIDILGEHMVITTSLLQRKLGIGYGKAKELTELMQAEGYVTEAKPGFYQRTRSQQDVLRSHVKVIVKNGRENMLDTALAMHAAWFFQTQRQEESAVDSAVDAVTGGQWGYSAISEPDITTVMRGQSVFYSKNTSLDLGGERIGRICSLLKTLSDRKNLTVLASLYELTVQNEKAYASPEKIAEHSRLSEDTVGQCIESLQFPYLEEQDGMYRIKGEAMATLPIISMLSY